MNWHLNDARSRRCIGWATNEKQGCTWCTPRVGQSGPQLGAFFLRIPYSVSGLSLGRWVRHEGDGSPGRPCWLPNEEKNRKRQLMIVMRRRMEIQGYKQAEYGKKCAGEMRWQTGVQLTCSLWIITLRLEYKSKLLIVILSEISEF